MPEEHAVDNKKDKQTRTETVLQARIALFRNRVFFWQTILGFINVEIGIGEQGESQNQISDASWCNPSEGSQLIMIYYSKPWLESSEATEFDIDKAAFHEVTEAQFHRIHGALNSIYSEEFISDMLHEIVRRAENCIFPLLRNMKKPEVINDNSIRG